MNNLHKVEHAVEIETLTTQLETSSHLELVPWPITRLKLPVCKTSLFAIRNTTALKYLFCNVGFQLFSEDFDGVHQMHHYFIQRAFSYNVYNQ
jgi:hypothetical protein